MNKKRFTGISFLFALLFLASSAFGQIKDIGKFAAAGEGGIEDATKLMTAYITPLANALGTSLSGGWYNTAKTHKPLGFDLTFTMNMGFVPASEKTFNMSELGLTTFTYDADVAQTAAGKKEAGPELAYEVGGTQLVSFPSPQGTGLGFMPAPMLQLSIGTVK